MSASLSSLSLAWLASLALSLGALTASAQPPTQPTASGLDSVLATEVHRPSRPMSRARARAIVRGLDELRERAVGGNRLEVTALADSTEIDGACTGSFLECLYWFRVVVVASNGDRSAPRFYGVDPYGGAVLRSNATRANERTTASTVRVEGRPAVRSAPRRARS